MSPHRLTAIGNPNRGEVTAALGRDLRVGLAFENNVRGEGLRHSDAAEFTEHTVDFLADRPIEHNVLATVAAALEARGRSDPPLIAWVQSSESGNVSAAVLRTLPWRLLASSMSAEAAAAMMPKLLEADPELPGVNGPQPAASHLAEAWRRCAGGKVDRR